MGEERRGFARRMERRGKERVVKGRSKMRRGTTNYKHTGINTSQMKEQWFIRFWPHHGLVN